jgi:hypothetical protein
MRFERAAGVGVGVVCAFYVYPSSRMLNGSANEVVLPANLHTESTEPAEPCSSRMSAKAVGVLEANESDPTMDLTFEITYPNDNGTSLSPERPV